MQLPSKLILGAIIATVAWSAVVVHTEHRGWRWSNVIRILPAQQLQSNNNNKNTHLRQHRTKRVEEEDDDEQVESLEEDEGPAPYEFSSMEGKFEWNKFQAPGYMEHIAENDDEDRSDFYITPTRAGERRLRKRPTSI